MSALLDPVLDSSQLEDDDPNISHLYPYSSFEVPAGAVALCGHRKKTQPGDDFLLPDTIRCVVCHSLSGGSV